MMKRNMVLAGTLLGFFCSCFLFVLPAFGEWGYEQVDEDCWVHSMWGAASETDIYIGGTDMGYIEDGGPPAACVYYNDGTGWERVGFPPEFLGVLDIWGNGPDDVYVVGINGRYHFDGTTWSQLGSGLSSWGFVLWGFQDSDIFLGYHGVERYQGSAWELMGLPPGIPENINIRGLWGLSESDMYAVGLSSTVLHYDGSPDGEWALFNTGLEDTNYDLYAVWGTSPDDIFAGGFSTLLHYDGSSWTKFDVDGINGETVFRIWGSAPDDVYAVTDQGTIRHYDGVSWGAIQSVPMGVQGVVPADNPGPAGLKTVWGSSSDSVYFAGDNGIVVHYTPSSDECETDTGCDDTLFCNGAETCSGGVCQAGTPVSCPGGEVCDEATDACVECLNDSDCSDGAYCNGAETCSGGACQAGTAVTCPGGEVCDEATDSCVECLNDSDCSDGAYCNGAETCSGGTCQAGTAVTCPGGFCDEAADRCVECLSDEHCAGGATCQDGMCVAPCRLAISYKQIVSAKLTKPRKVTLKISGGEGFDPAAIIDIGPLQVVRSRANSTKGLLKVKARVPAGLPAQVIPVRVGSCLGEIEIL